MIGSCRFYIVIVVEVVPVFDVADGVGFVDD